MGSLNKWMGIGRLTADPEKRTTQSGTSVTSFNLATSEIYKDTEGNKQEKTEFHRIVAWGKLADLSENYLNKGSQIYLEGSLGTKEWQDKDGNKRYTTEITMKELKFIDTKNSQQNSSNKKSYDKDSNPLTHNITPDLIEDDVPF